MSDLYSFSCSFKANSMINWDHTLPSSADSKKTQKKWHWWNLTHWSNAWVEKEQSVASIYEEIIKYNMSF